MYKKSLLIIGCLAFIWNALAQQKQVSGKVTDASEGTSIPGVSILVKGTTRGAVTDTDGNYTIEASDDNVLVFSFIGYASQEVQVGSQTQVNIKLVISAKELEEIVVIGYGEKSRKLLTESIGVVNPEQIQKLPVASADAAIQGRISGVQVTSVDGTPGAPVSIRIRGVGTTGNTQPLYVIDGIPVGNADGYNTNPLSALNPNDIENISVLKDASSAAVYGVRAANGVVLITTKRGKSGKPQVSIDSYYGVQNFRKQYDWNNTDQYIKLTQEALDNRNAQDGLTSTSPGFRVLNPDLQPNGQYRNVNNDWQKAVIVKNAPITNTNVSVSGGNDVSNFYVSGGYFAQEAMVPKWKLDRYTFRANSDHKVGSKFKMGQTLTLSYQEVERGSNAGGDGFLYAGTANMPPFFRIYEDPSDPIPGNRYGFDGNVAVAGLNIANQFAINEIVDRRDKTMRLLGGIYGELEIINGLKFRSAASLDFSYDRNNEWQPSYSAAETGLNREENNYSDNRSENYTQVFTNTLNYAHTFGSHSINLLTGVEYQKLRGTNLGYTGYNFLSSEPSFYQSVRNGTGTTQNINGGPAKVFGNAGSGLYEDGYSGYIGRISYNYAQKYLLTISVRRDGTARFAPENRWGTFPSVSGAWRISEENFFPKSIISDLKLRGSWGQLGNSNTSSFPYIFRVTFAPDYGLGSVSYQAPSQASFVNRDVKWERVETVDVGFDVSFLENKINLLATYYNRTTKDFLFNLPLPFLSGFGSTPVNAGSVNNKGIELELEYKDKIADQINFSVSGNITTVKNRLVSLAPGVEEFSSGEYRTAVGQPIGYFYGFRTLGIYQNVTQAANALPDQTISALPQPGDIIFEDNNGPAEDDAPEGQQFSGIADGQIDNNDRTYLGKTIPDFYYGLSLNADYKGLDLSILFQGVAGVQVYNSYRSGAENLSGYGRNTFTTTNARWTGEGTSNSMPRAVAGDPYNNGRFSDRWIEDAGFFRLKNVQLGYSIPTALLAKTKSFTRARIYLAATNLFTITDYTGLDPEVMTYGSNSNQLGAGTDQANIPQPRTVQAGIQLQF